MKILLDTQCWLWWIAWPERLSAKAEELLRDGANEIFFSSASAWEIAIKYAIGKLALPEAPHEFVPRRLARDRVHGLAVTIPHALQVAALPPHHRDPFDRLLVAQSVLEGIPLMSADPQLRAYDVELIEASR